MRAKKSLGQHFLTSNQVVDDIVATAVQKNDEVVVEIGPGMGVLTRALLERGSTVHAVELDLRMIEHLSTVFQDELEAGRLRIIHQDILSFDPASEGFSSRTFKIVGNIPYYITGAILRHFLTSTCQPEKMVLLVQKEVAERIAARDGKESILSISVKAFGTPAIVRKVSKKLFSPKPKVDSAVISIENISKDFFGAFDESTFFKLVRAGFAHKRKKLSSNLKGVVPENCLQKFFEETMHSTNVRAEDLTLSDWKKLAEYYAQ